jgi:formyltetrahydrofolate hydrolase
MGPAASSGREVEDSVATGRDIESRAPACAAMVHADTRIMLIARQIVSRNAYR